MTKHPVAAALVAALFTATILAGSAAATPPALSSSTRVGTHLNFAVTFRPFEQNYIDMGSVGPGIGDTLVFQDELRDTQGRQVGIEGGSCTITAVLDTGFQTLCTGSISLRDGQIAYQGLVSNAPTKQLAITGGTGKYLGARGDAVLIELGHDNLGTLTLHLLPHDD